jgi:hypothetical protein
MLSRIAPFANIAQFVSYGPDLRQRFSCVIGNPPNQQFPSLEEACSTLLASAESKKVNVRTFKPGATKGNKLVRNLNTVAEVASLVRQRARNGFFAIINESIPLDDGGVSGVVTNEVIEFAPGDTPKCVDGPGVSSLPTAIGLQLLEIVFGFRPDLPLSRNHRVEFSIHPIRRGVKRMHTIVWELEAAEPFRKVQIGKWPNLFSEMVGDKAYGLLIAHILGFRVPRTTVFARRVAPFSFGTSTGTQEVWLRTAPPTPVPGLFPTVYGWTDPYALMAAKDPAGTNLASVLAQESVEFVWSGAARTTETGPSVEGLRGQGDKFMVGGKVRQDVLATVHAAVNKLHNELVSRLRSVKFEWVWDGAHPWIVQLHRSPKAISRDIIYPGEPSNWEVFNPHAFSSEDVLGQLRELVARVAGKDIGVIVSGDIGVTSHVGDILSEACVPSRREWRSPIDAEQSTLWDE